MRAVRSWGVVLLLVLPACSAEPEIPRPNLSGAEAEVIAAVSAAEQRVREDPTSAERWGALGDRYRVQQWNAEAVRCYARAEELEPGEFRWPYLIGKLLRHDDPRGADEAFARAEAIDGGYAPLLVLRGRGLVRLGRTDEARDRFERAHRADPALADPLVGLGQIALGAGGYQQARDRFRLALQRDPRDGRAHHGMAQAEMALGNSRAAEGHAAEARRNATPRPLPDPRAASAAEPAGSWGWTQYGRRLLAGRRIDEAVAALERAVAINPRRQTARLGLGLALVLQGQTAEAETHLREAVRLDPGDPQARAALGNLLAALGPERHDEARAELEAAIRLDPDRADARATLARLSPAEVDGEDAIK